MKQITIDVFPIDELSPKATERAYQDWLETTEVFYECAYDDSCMVAKCLGIEIDDINFSGFHSQGDGAMFVGEYIYNPEWKNMLNDYAPLDDKLKAIGEDLESLYDELGDLSVTVTHDRSRYSHENTAEFELKFDNDEYEYHRIIPLENALKQFMKWIYKQYEETYEYQTSVDCFTDTVTNDDNHYTIAGKLV
jgi:hypothetical protein